MCALLRLFRGSHRPLKRSGEGVGRREALGMARRNHDAPPVTRGRRHRFSGTWMCAFALGQGEPRRLAKCRKPPVLSGRRKKGRHRSDGLSLEDPKMTTEGMMSQRDRAGSSPQSGLGLRAPRAMEERRESWFTDRPAVTVSNSSLGRRPNQLRQGRSTNPHIGVHPGPGCWSFSGDPSAVQEIARAGC